MITVNLKPGQKRKRAGTNPFKGMLDNFRGLEQAQQVLLSHSVPILRETG